jgi:hypothetical protein
MKHPQQFALPLGLACALASVSCLQALGVDEEYVTFDEELASTATGVGGATAQLDAVGSGGYGGSGNSATTATSTGTSVKVGAGVSTSGTTSSTSGTTSSTSGTTSSNSVTSTAASGGTGGGGCNNRALSFDGNSSSVFVNDTVALDSFGPLTVEAWIRPGPGVVSDEKHILAHHNHGNTEGYLLLIRNQAVGFRYYGGGQTGEAKDAAPQGFVPGDWYHVAGTFDAITKTVHVFIDGQHRGQTTMVASASDDCNCVVTIGSNQGADPDFGFDGLIDEVRVSSTARYTASFVPPVVPFTTDLNTVALWHFDETQGDIAIDATGSHPGHLGGSQGFGGSAPVRTPAPCIADMLN